ncbi:MAG: hypothetical protein JO191_02255 [Mycobacteriaceae bacterium]|nr:hypothetical protein [Mycobacteriaceae bacterium]
MMARLASRIARLSAVAGVSASFITGAAPIAATVSADPAAVCSSEVVSGVEVDNCVPNPHADIVSDTPGVNVGLEGGIGVGFGG